MAKAIVCRTCLEYARIMFQRLDKAVDGEHRIEDEQGLPVGIETIIPVLDLTNCSRMWLEHINTHFGAEAVDAHAS